MLHGHGSWATRTSLQFPLETWGPQACVGGGNGVTSCATWAAPSGASQVGALCLTQVPWQVVTWVQSPDERSRCL